MYRIRYITSAARERVIDRFAQPTLRDDIPCCVLCVLCRITLVDRHVRSRRASFPNRFNQASMTDTCILAAVGEGAHRWRDCLR